jgi:hypothetical protein
MNWRRRGAGLYIGTGPSAREHQIIARMSKMLSREEIMVKQRARMDWLKEGDRNIAFFQAKSRMRSKQNSISSLEKG